MNGAADTIFLVDDDPAVLESLKRLVRAAGFAVQGFDSAEVFLEQHDLRWPGCAVFDLSLRGLDGLELQQALIARGDDRPIIFLSGHGDVPNSVQAMKAGAVDFLTKPVDGEALLAAIRIALERDRRRREERDEVGRVKLRIAALTPREREVLDHIIAGRLNKQIAGALGVAEKTVKVHRGRVMVKMGVRSVAELVRLTEHVGISPDRSVFRAR